MESNLDHFTTHTVAFFSDLFVLGSDPESGSKVGIKSGPVFFKPKRVILQPVRLFSSGLFVLGSDPESGSKSGYRIRLKTDPEPSIHVIRSVEVSMTHLSDTRTSTLIFPNLDR